MKDHVKIFLLKNLPRSKEQLVPQDIPICLKLSEEMWTNK